MRANLDVLIANPELAPAERARILDDVLAQQQRLTDVLGGLEALARGEVAAGRPRERVDLGELVDEAVATLRQRHPATEVRVRDPGSELELEGWPEGLRLLLGNLLENAALHGAGGDGRACVEVTLERAGGGLRLLVDDAGPGIAEAERDRVLVRFERGTDTTTPGSGLGLAIVELQARLHGGGVRLAGSPLGGTRVVVTLASR
jgi:two-component system sensor histidine kinase PrrB